MPSSVTVRAWVTVEAWAWLHTNVTGPEARRLRALFATLSARGIAQDALIEALRLAYWAARRSMVTGVEARARRGLERRIACLAKAEEAITAVLDLEEPVPSELAGHLHVARARLRLAAREVRLVEAAPRGRPRGWHVEAERTLLGLGLRRSEARTLLTRIERLVQANPVRLREGPPLRVAFRAPEPVRTAIIGRFPLPAADKDFGR